MAKVGGYSLVARAVQSALRSGVIDHCVVSSDDDEILREGELFGALPLRRDPELAQDDTSTIDVVRGSLAFVNSLDDPSLLVLLQATSPFRAPEDIVACVERSSATGSAATICALEHPIEWTFECDQQMRIGIPKGGVPLRRQDAERRYRLAGSVYATAVDRISSGAMLVDSSTLGVVVPHHRALDIDEPMDLEVARSLAGTDWDPLGVESARP